ncbi:uncharacterized protein [Montipora capricornis]|uniref:uncharacterized protein isoform X3 n=1 Tax=Montipora capricornis TaxID=246305 RepID=UPI0035F21C52
MRVILAVLLLTILAISRAAYKVHNSPVYDTETEKGKKMHDFSESLTKLVNCLDQNEDKHFCFKKLSDHFLRNAPDEVPAEDSEEGEFSDLEDFADWELIQASDEQTQKPEKLTCPIYEPPENGALVINYFGLDPMVQVQCKRGYDFVTIPPQLYLCAAGEWHFVDFFGTADKSLPWPNCALTNTPGQRKMGQLPALFYFDGDCNDPNTQVNIKASFISLARLVQLCIDATRTCSQDTVQVFCGNVTQVARRRRRSTVREMAVTNLINCMASNGFKPSMGCMRKFQKDMPEWKKPEYAEKSKCLFRAAKECWKIPQDGMHLTHCLDGIKKCGVQGIESST